MSDRLKWLTLESRKVFKWQCDPAPLAIRFSKRCDLSDVRGRCTCYASICPSDTKCAPHTRKWLFLDTNTDARRPLSLTSSTCSFWCAALESTAAADGRWFPSSPPDTPPVSPFTLQALLHTLAFYYLVLLFLIFTSSHTKYGLLKNYFYYSKTAGRQVQYFTHSLWRVFFVAVKTTIK